MFQFDAPLSGKRGAALKASREFLGSAGSLPAMLGSLPSTIFVGKLPTNAGWQPALPKPELPRLRTPDVGRK
jgi:hypothetical protein